MLQKTNTQKELKIYLKAEPKPAFIDSDLLPYYEQTDLTLTWVYECCLSLKPLKGIDVNDMQVEFWYKEFIRMGWKKKDFDRQFEAIKRATLYNRIDLENWLNTEETFNEIDFNVSVQRRVDTLIQRGNYLKESKDQLSDADKKYIQLAAVQKFEFECTRERSEKIEKLIEEEKNKMKQSNQKKKEKISKLSLAEKVKILDRCITENKFPEIKETSGWLYNMTLHNLEDFSDLIPEEYL